MSGPDIDVSVVPPGLGGISAHPALKCWADLRCASGARDRDTGNMEVSTGEPWPDGPPCWHGRMADLVG